MSARIQAEPLASAEQPQATHAAIQVENLGHRYGDRTALDGISFDVRAAEIFGLLGPNGS